MNRLSIIVLLTALAASLSSVAVAETVRGKTFSLCGSGKRVDCVVDGDTFWLGRMKVRIADIDAPEIGQAKCQTELGRGVRAQKRLLALLNAGSFDLRGWQGRDQDRYGRKLRVVVRDGRSIGDQLVSEGLARAWSGRRESWCS